MSIEFATGGGPAIEWIKSSYSSNEHGSDCVEVAAASGEVRVRDSKCQEGARLAFGGEAWAGFLGHVAGR